MDGSPHWPSGDKERRSIPRRPRPPGRQLTYDLDADICGGGMIASETHKHPPSPGTDIGDNVGLAAAAGDARRHHNCRS